MTKTYHDQDADLSLIQGKKVAILGYGSQGHAHALNLRDSGVDVRVGLPAGSRSRAKGEAAGLKVLPPSEAAAWGHLISLPLPDSTLPAVYRPDVAPNLKKG